MKKTIALLVLSSALTLSADNHDLSAGAPAKNDRNFQVLLNPLVTATGSLWAATEIKVSDGISLRIPVSFRFLSGSLPEIPTGELKKDPNWAKTPQWFKDWAEGPFAVPNNVSIGLGAKFFLSGKTFESGWYIFPELMVGYNWGENVDGVTLTTQLLFGYGWVFDTGFSLNLGIGAYYNKDFGPQTLSPPIPMPNGEFALGYAW